MRILLLATDIYGGHGGIALYNRDLVAALSRLEECHEIVVVPRLIPYSWDESEVPPQARFIASAARGAWSYARTLLDLARQRFDLVICSHINLAPAAKLISGHPLLITYGIEAWRPTGRPFARKILQSCGGIVAISRITRERLLSWLRYDGPTFLLPNAIHSERYGIRPKRPDLVARYGLAGKRVLLTVGRLATEERYKGFEEVIEVLPRLPQDVVHVIAGGGQDEQRLRMKAAAAGVDSRVIMTGFFPESDKADLYALADVYVMPSRGEGFGFVFLEAMASGVPVIASKHDGGREALLDGKLGLLVDPANPAEIEAAIVETLATSRDRSIDPRLEEFSFETFSSRAATIIRSVTRS